MAMELIPETLPEIIKTTSSGVSIIRSSIWIIDYFARHEPVHIKERLGRSLESISRRMREEDQRGNLRNDWFAENEVSGNRIPHRLLEKTIKGIIKDSEERKSEYVDEFWTNVCRTCNADIDEATAFSYLETIEALSWRQLCIIGLIGLQENEEKEVGFRRISDEDVEQMPQDEMTRFYSIGRDYQNLMDDRYIEGASVPQFSEIHEPFVGFPGSGRLPGYTKRLHSLMNLHEIPDREMEETFSIWNVRLRKPTVNPKR